MENREKGEVVEGKDTLIAGQVEMAICHKKGFPLEIGRQQVHAHN